MSALSHCGRDVLMIYPKDCADIKKQAAITLHEPRITLCFIRATLAQKIEIWNE